MRRWQMEMVKLRAVKMRRINTIQLVFWLLVLLWMKVSFHPSYHTGFRITAITVMPWSHYAISAWGSDSSTRYLASMTLQYTKSWQWSEKNLCNGLLTILAWPYAHKSGLSSRSDDSRELVCFRIGTFSSSIASRCNHWSVGDNVHELVVALDLSKQNFMLERKMS